MESTEYPGPTASNGPHQKWLCHRPDSYRYTALYRTSRCIAAGLNAVMTVFIHYVPVRTHGAPPWMTPPLITTSLFMHVLLASTTNSPVFRVMLSAASITMDLIPRTYQRPVTASYSNQPPSEYSITQPSTESDGGANWLE